MYLIYRAHDQGPLGKAVWRLPEPTVLEWVVAACEEAGAVRGHWGERHLGGRLNFLDYRLLRRPAPQTLGEMRAWAKDVAVGERSVRMLTSEKWWETAALYFLDDAEADARPEVWAFPLHDGPLPDDAGTAGSPGSYAVFLPDARPSFAESTHAFPGLDLSELGAGLLARSPDGLPRELRALRGLMRAGEEGIGQAITRYASGLDDVGAEWTLRQGEHLVQLLAHSGATSEQWFLFDGHWAASHPELAASLMRYARHWDPLCVREHPLDLLCREDRIHYVAVCGQDGEVVVRPYEARDEPGLARLSRWEMREEDYTAPTPGDVLAEATLTFEPGSSHVCRISSFVDIGTYNGLPPASDLAERVRRLLGERGVTRVVGAYTDLLLTLFPEHDLRRDDKGWAVDLI